MEFKVQSLKNCEANKCLIQQGFALHLTSHLGHLIHFFPFSIRSYDSNLLKCVIRFQVSENSTRDLSVKFVQSP